MSRATPFSTGTVQVCHPPQEKKAQLARQGPSRRKFGVRLAQVARPQALKSEIQPATGSSPLVKLPVNQP